jgi:hypothetical protein
MPLHKTQSVVCRQALFPAANPLHQAQRDYLKVQHGIYDSP